jgi:hypothetical protein
MSKHANKGIGPDNWLHIASHALSLYVEEGGALVARAGESGLSVELPGVTVTDTRLHEKLRALVAEHAAAAEPSHG